MLRSILTNCGSELLVTMQYVFQGYYTLQIVLVCPVQDRQQRPARKVGESAVQGQVGKQQGSPVGLESPFDRSIACQGRRSAGQLLPPHRIPRSPTKPYEKR